MTGWGTGIIHRNVNLQECCYKQHVYSSVRHSERGKEEPMKELISLSRKTILVTGAAGFIGANLAMRLLQEHPDSTIVGIDNVNDYYDVGLKEYRLDMIRKTAQDTGDAARWIFIRGSIADKALIDELFAKYQFDIVVNLAAQAGVRYSIDHPDVYIESNIIGFYNILEACRHSYDHVTAGSTASGSSAASDSSKASDSSTGSYSNEASGSSAASDSSTTSDSNTASGDNASSSGAASSSQGNESRNYQGVQHLVYASSSSVYGGNRKVPFSTDDPVDHPVSLYAATKKSNELLAHSYSKLYDIPSTGLRFFTVYGPAGRPDMFYFSATQKLTRGESIKIFNYGNCRRDFTYIDDIVEGVVRVMQGAPAREKGEDGLPVPPYAVYNIGGGQPENLLDYIQTLQEELVEAGVLPADYDFAGHQELVGMQPGDVPVTYADSAALERDYGFTPRIGIREGLRAFCKWYKDYYQK